jgi:8-oxo-dGTP pyrophosphatase MutT (NUDIX family)
MAIHSAITLETVRTALRLPLPGRAAQVTMSAHPRPGDRPDLPPHCPREGAVMLLIYPRQGRWVMPLTLRTDKVESHKGQVSLPGGAREPGDDSFEATALRETWEELGTPSEPIELLGRLTPLYIPSSGFCVYPFVGWTPQAIALCFDPNEVAAVIEAPLDDLLNPTSRRVETHVHDGKTLTIPLYQVGNAQVWGATAMIMAEFLALLRATLQEE